MRVLICGDRHWTDKKAIEHFIERMPKNTVIIHGGAKGADSIAGRIAEKHGLRTLIFLANWKKYGKAAGPIRNKQMLDEGKPDYVICFHKDLSKSKGTANMYAQAKKRGIKTFVLAGLTSTALLNSNRLDHA